MTRFVVLTLLLAAIAFVVRRRARGTGPARSLKVTARAAIGRGTSLVVVEVEGRRLLVGAAANQMNVLAELSDAELVGFEADAPPREQPSRSQRPNSERPNSERPNSERPNSERQGSLVERLRAMTVRTLDPDRRGQRPTTPTSRSGHS